MVSDFLDGQTLEVAIARKEIFIVNHDVMDGIKCPGEERIVSF